MSSNERERLQEIITVIKECQLLKDLSPSNLRLAIEALGPTFIKMGQILSSRDDILPKEYCDELKKLRSQVKPMPFIVVKGILSDEFNGMTDAIFESIEEKPIGSASIAQVHKAVLKTGEQVVVKVQRENIYEMMDTDVKLLKKAVLLLQVDRLLNSVFDVSAVIDEMFETAKEEMDFQIEAGHMQKFKELNSDIVYIGVPKVYEQYTTSKVLVMEEIKGHIITDKKSLLDLGYDMDEIAEKLAANYVKQTIDDGYFHADPHPDNLKIDNGKIIYLDFGMMGSLSKRDRDLLSKCILAIVKNDVREVSHILLTLGEARGQVDHMQLCNDIRNVLNKNLTKDAKDIDIKDFTNDMFSMLSSNRITLPKDITMLLRGIVVIEGVLKDISDNISLLKILETHINPRQIVTKEKVQDLFSKGIQSGTDLVYIPNELLTFLQGVNSGELRFNIELNDSKHQIRNIEQLVHLVIITILDVAYIIGTSLIVMNHEDDLPFIFYIYLILGGLCTLWLFYKLFRSKLKNRKR